MRPIDDDDRLVRLLAEQIAYYRAVAPEYGDHALPAPGGAELEAALEAFRPAGDVLELACGPGTWTEQLLRHAARVTAVDASAEMLALAAARVRDERVRFVRADLFEWRPDRRYDVVFFGFWLSHVPLERFASFWGLVADCARRARVLRRRRPPDPRGAARGRVLVDHPPPPARRQRAPGGEGRAPAHGAGSAAGAAGLADRRDPDGRSVLLGDGRDGLRVRPGGSALALGLSTARTGFSTAGPGFEPGLTVPETAVLPLHHPAVYWRATPARLGEYMGTSPQDPSAPLANIRSVTSSRSGAGRAVMWNGSTSSGQPAGGSSVRGDTRVPGSEPPASADPASTRERVVALRREGRSATQIATALGVSKSTVCYHLRRLGVEPDERCNRRYDWGAIQRFYDEGHSVTECLAHFGCSRKSFHDAWKRGRISTRPQAMPLGQLLAEPRQRGHIKLRLLRLGLKENRCEACGIDSWRGSPLAMALHHVNGDGRDNRLENLQLLCPNCHSQTPNFAGRNRGRRLVAGA